MTFKYILLGGIAAISMVPMQALAERVLSFTTSTTPSAPESPILEAWAKEIEEGTDGEIKIEFYYQQSLSKLGDNLDAVSSGLADMGLVVPAYSRQKLPLNYLSSTSTGTGDPFAILKAWSATRENFPVIAAEDTANGVHFLASHSIGSVLFVGDKAYNSPDDLDGATMRLSSHYAYAAKADNWNVNPARIRSPETYTSLEKGTITGATTYTGQIYQYKLNEVADNVTVLNLGQHMNVYYMSLDTWNDLSTEEQAVFNDLAGPLMEDLAQVEIEYAAEVLEAVAKDETYPMKITYLSDAQRAVWAENLKKSYLNNVANAAKVSADAPEIGEFYLNQIDAQAEEIKSGGYPWN